MGLAAYLFFVGLQKKDPVKAAAGVALAVLWKK